MKHCSRCLEIKSLESFSHNHRGRLKAMCKPCRVERARERRLEHKGSPPRIPSHLVPAFHLLRRLYQSYNRTTPLQIPVRPMHHVVDAQNACILKPERDGYSWLHIASIRGSRTMMWEMTGPLDLIRTLQELGLEIVLPTEQESRNRLRSSS